jgi:hypothetical protein
MLIALATASDSEPLVKYAYDDIGVASVTTPELLDAGGGLPYPMPVRILSTKITNNLDDPLQFIVFLEVRDSKGITIFLEFHKGTVESGGRTEVGSSWRLPQEQGEYELRAFAVSNVTSPTVIAWVKSANVTAGV